MPQVAAAIEALDPEHVAGALRNGGRVGINVDGHDHELGADDLTLAMRPLAGYQLEREGSHAVALELELDGELIREMLAREIVHAVQNARKAAGLRVEDRIELGLGGDAELLAAARVHEETVRGETLAVALDYEAADGEAAVIEGRPLTVALRRHEHASLEEAANAPAPMAAPGEQAERLERERLVREALDELRPRCRELLTRLFLTPTPPGEAGSRTSYADIARDLGMPIGSIGPTRLRCLQELARILAGRLEP